MNRQKSKNRFPVTDILLKVSVIVVTLLIGVSVFYYFVVFQPHQQELLRDIQIQQKEADQLKNTQDMQVKCQNAGEKVIKAEKDRWAAYGISNAISVGQYYYNQKLNMCLVSWDDDGGNGGFVSGCPRHGYIEWVRNSLTNETVVYFAQGACEGDQSALDKRQAEFEKQYNQLFSE